MKPHALKSDGRTIGSAVVIVACAALCWSGRVAEARTIVLTEEDCTEMAAISPAAPRMSWAGVENAAHEFGTNTIDLYKHSSFLIRYPFDKIPPGQRITRAEWVIPHQLASPAGGARLSVRRILASWGAGVSFEHRMTRPQKLPWSTPGARGVGQDRAAQATAVGLIKGSGEQSFNVTQDVELWYSGAAKNHGWIITLEDSESWVRLASPVWSAPKGWILRITYEPQ